MYGMFVNQLSHQGVKYADLIADGLKTIETRNKNMLKDLVGQRVAIVRTVRGKSPVIIGTVFVLGATWHNRSWLEENRNKTLILPGSKYDVPHGKWCYLLSKPRRCEPFDLPADAIRHGRSWCEFKLPHFPLKTI